MARDNSPEKPGRDDTPSAIQQVEQRASLLGNGSTDSEIPVLTMPKSIRIWRRVRWPLLAFSITVILATVGLITRDLLVARGVARTIEEAHRAQAIGTIPQIQSAGHTLHELAQAHPNQPNAQVSWAWHAALEAVLLGPAHQRAKQAQTALALASGEESSVAWAARALLAYIQGNLDNALKLSNEKQTVYPNEPRLALVHILALTDAGKIEQAQASFDAARKKFPTYLPLLIAHMVGTFEAGHRQRAAELAKQLTAVSPAHVYSTLVAIALSLPKWHASPPDAGRVATMAADIDALTRIIEKAPPKLMKLGYFLIGRVELLLERPQRAIIAFDNIVDEVLKPEVLAWKAVALQQGQSPLAALKWLDAHPDITSAEILDIRAQCLLAYHRTREAEKTLDALTATQKYRVRTKKMRWILAIRSGDTQTALANLPQRIDAADQWVAVELYHALKAAGDADGISRLVTALSPELLSCGEAMDAWHKNDPSSAFKALKKEETEPASCIDALAIGLLRGRKKPADLKTAAAHVESAAGSNLRLEIDAAMVSWWIAGIDAAATRLNNIWKLDPDGSPILCALGSAYLELDMPEKALEVLEGVTDPTAIALQILAALKAKKEGLLPELLEQASQMTQHPATAYAALLTKANTENVPDIPEKIAPLLENAGPWTSELAALSAQAMSLRGDRADADRLLYQLSKKVTKAGGLDESWQTTLEQIRLNVRRGGRSLYRALFLITMLREEGVDGPDILYNYAIANLEDGNERLGLKYLKGALALNPAFQSAYAKLAAMDRLEDDLVAAMARARPGWQP
ncbi:MAG: hypothetical protein QNJ97_24415 [Myxococcota bacterium]|nr:hypothetical protein [Myxococcota bacterium]